MPRAGRDFEHARIARRRDNLDQLAQMIGVANRGRGRVVVGLPGEFFADQIFVLDMFHCGHFAVPAHESSARGAPSRRLHG